MPSTMFYFIMQIIATAHVISGRVIVWHGDGSVFFLPPNALYRGLLLDLWTMGYFIEETYRHTCICVSPYQNMWPINTRHRNWYNAIWEVVCVHCINLYYKRHNWIKGINSVSSSYIAWITFLCRKHIVQNSCIKFVANHYSYMISQ